MTGGGGDGGGNRTVFRPSPLQGLRQNTTPPQPGGAPGYSPSAVTMPPGPFPANFAPQLPTHDDIPAPRQAQAVRNRLMMAAGPILALAASIRSGRARTPLAQFHGRATEAIAEFDRAITPHYPDEMRQRAKYALCSTLDDIAQNLPGAGADGAEWARRSMVVQTFQENIGGDRFWQLVDDMLAKPQGQGDLIELFHACLAAGFEGRFRRMEDGKRRLHEIMRQLYSALDHVRSLSPTELVAGWRGENAPLRRIGTISQVALAAAIAAGVLLLLFIVLRLMLMASGRPAWDALSGINPDQRLTLARDGGAAPAAPPGEQSSRLKTFLAPEIAQKLVVVDEDAQTVRVRTTVGQLFKSGSDALEVGREPLFRRIGEAIEREPGDVTVEGHSDSDRVSSLTFPDNVALSAARADAVTRILAGVLSDPGRLQAKALGDARPIASNDTTEGKALNRRVEIVIPRTR